MLSIYDVGMKEKVSTTKIDIDTTGLLFLDEEN
jgi:hypothetical protein